LLYGGISIFHLKDLFNTNIKLKEHIRNLKNLNDLINTNVKFKGSMMHLPEHIYNISISFCLNIYMIIYDCQKKNIYI
jgi:hypothetical protein